MTASSLARAMGITSGRTSNLLKQLEGKGSIERTRGTRDLRSVEIRATEKGSLLARVCVDEQSLSISETLRSLGYRELPWLRL